MDERDFKVTNKSIKLLENFEITSTLFPFSYSKNCDRVFEELNLSGCVKYYPGGVK